MRSLWLAGALISAAASPAVARESATEHDAAAAKAASAWNGPAAIAAMRRAISAEPADAWRHARLAALLLASGDAVGAEASARAARTNGATPEATRALLAAAIWAQGEPARALGELSAGPVDPRFTGRAAWVRGQILLARDDVAGARDALDLAAARLPRFAPVWMDVARMRLANADPAGAQEAIDYALRLSPRRPRALVIKAEIAREQRGLGEAVALYDAALAGDPRSVTALLGKAAALGDLGRYREMLAAVRRAMALHKGHPRGYLLQAVMAARAGDMPLARGLMRRTRGALDDEPATMLVQAIIEMDLRGGQVAADWADKLVALQPDNRTARAVLAAAEWADGDAAATREVLAPVVARADADHWSLTLAARAASVLGDPVAAAALEQRGAALSRGEAEAFGRSDPYAVLAGRAAAQPLNPAVVVPAIRAALAGGQRARADAMAQTLLAPNRAVADAQLIAGDVALFNNDPDRAVRAFREARRLRASDITAMKLANAQYRARDPAGAAATIMSGLTANPSSVAMNRLAGHFFLDIGRAREAADRFTFVQRRTGPRDAVLLRALAQAQAAAGDPEGAKRSMAEAYRLAPLNRPLMIAYAALLRATGDGAGAAELDRKLAALAAQPSASATRSRTSSP